MSQEVRSADPVELTRRLYEAADRGDCDAMMGLFRPDAVWDLSEAGIGTSRARQRFAASSKTGKGPMRTTRSMSRRSVTSATE